jgi:hypothetical protein
MRQPAADRYRRGRLAVGGHHCRTVIAAGHAGLAAAGDSEQQPGHGRPSGGRILAGRRAVAGGLLSVRCAPGGYFYTAGHPGTGIISATVGPRCSPGQMCPQWLTEPQLHVTVT